MSQRLTEQTDWVAWSRESVRMMQERNDRYQEAYELAGAHYQWNLNQAELVFRSAEREVVANLCVIGTVSASEGTFLWAWANEGVPEAARRGIEKVREFGWSKQKRPPLKPILLATPQR